MFATNLVSINDKSFDPHQEPSVDLATQILDGTPLRPDSKTPIPMSVTKAKFEQKGQSHGISYSLLLH